MRDATSKGQMERVPCFSTISRYLNQPELTPILVSLIEQSAVPLAGIEEDFAIDSTALAPTSTMSGFEEKHGKKKKGGKRKKFITCHIMCGVKTRIVAASR